MPVQNTSEKSVRDGELTPRGLTGRRRPVLRPPSLGAQPLIRLKAGQCRFCLVDAPRGRMDEALFCAAPVRSGPYCPAHRTRCVAPPAEDIDTLVAEIEAALKPQT
jgi:hypothetical protein